MLATWAPRQPKMAWSGSPTTKTLPCSQGATGLFKLTGKAWAAWSPLESSQSCFHMEYCKQRGLSCGELGVPCSGERRCSWSLAMRGRAPHLLPSKLLDELKLGGVCVLQSRSTLSRTQSWHVQGCQRCACPGLHSETQHAAEVVTACQSVHTCSLLEMDLVGQA